MLYEACRAEYIGARLSSRRFALVTSARGARRGAFAWYMWKRAVVPTALCAFTCRRVAVLEALGAEHFAACVVGRVRSALNTSARCARSRRSARSASVCDVSSRRFALNTSVYDFPQGASRSTLRRLCCLQARRAEPFGVCCSSRRAALHLWAGAVLFEALRAEHLGVWLS